MRNFVVDQSFIAIGIDPGKTTGFAVFRSGLFTSQQIHPAEVTAFIYPWTDDLLRQSFIFMERFMVGQNTAKHSAQRDAEEIIGAVKDVCKTRSNVVIELQSAADAKRIGNDKLKRLEWYRPGLPHANDAARHVLSGLLRRFPRTYYELIQEKE